MQQNPDRLGRVRPIEMAAEIQGNYPNFKQNLAEKEKFVNSKSAKARQGLENAVSEEQGPIG